MEEETLTDNGITRTNIALRNVEVLLRLVSNLINFERTDVYSSKMSVSEYELNTYMNEIYNSFSSYAAIRRIEYTYESTFSYMNVSFDKEKMDFILIFFLMLSSLLRKMERSAFPCPIRMIHGK